MGHVILFVSFCLVFFTRHPTPPLGSREAQASNLLVGPSFRGSCLSRTLSFCVAVRVIVAKQTRYVFMFRLFVRLLVFTRAATFL